MIIRYLVKEFHCQFTPKPRCSRGLSVAHPFQLAAFTEFFLKTCIDQLAFMEELVEPARLRDRIQIWCDEETRGGRLPPKSSTILEAVLYRVEVPRGEIPSLLGASERQARRVSAALIEREVLTSESSRAALYRAFPATLASRWMPGLFPERAG